MSQFDPFQGFANTVTTSGTAIELSPQPYNNTHTILVYNGSANELYLRWQTNANTINAANGVRVPPGGSIQIAMGPKSLRPSSGAATLRADASANTTIFNVTYVNGVTL